MFQNFLAIETLINSDLSATQEEKNLLLKALKGELPVLEGQKADEVMPAVVKIPVAAKMLGYKSSYGVYKALRDGVLQGYYGGKSGKRITGVITKSIQKALHQM